LNGGRSADLCGPPTLRNDCPTSRRARGGPVGSSRCRCAAETLSRTLVIAAATATKQ
jgi:hypothetical protein